MVFSSIVFIFFFLPAVLIGYYSLRESLRFPFLLISGLFFYFYGETYLILVMLTTTSIDYCCGLLISGGFRQKQPKLLDPEGPRTRSQKAWLIISITSNLALLGYFKYFNFFTDNLIHILDSMHMSHLRLNGLVKVSLPLGISFYTFQSMSYTIDVYRGHVKANRSLLRFATFVTMFPQLVAGPIVRYADIEKQLLNHSVSLDRFVDGIKRFIIGLAKKVLIANTLGGVADQIFAMNKADLSTSLAWIGVIAYSLQIYFDFSGYSCMAIGLAKMLGFDLLENFNYPYISRSIKEFWRRWHISLSTWFRDYLYIPLGGSRSSGVRTYRNLLIVFLLCGLWHGASWNFVIWGLFHGVFLSLERMRPGKWLKALPEPVSHLYVLMVLMISWVFFRSDTLGASFGYLGRMFSYHGQNTFQLREILQPDVLLAFAFGILFSLPVIPGFLRFKDSLRQRAGHLAEAGYMAALFMLMLLSTMHLASGTFNPFIYFRF